MLALLLSLLLFLLLLKLPKVPPRGKLIQYFTLPRSPPREAVAQRPAMREAGTLCFGCGCGCGVGGCVGGGLAQRPATRGAVPRSPPREAIAQRPAMREAGTLGFGCAWACGGGATREGKGGRIAKGGRLVIYVAQRPATREAGTLRCPEARHAGGWDLTLPRSPPRGRLGL